MAVARTHRFTAAEVNKKESSGTRAQFPLHSSCVRRSDSSSSRSREASRRRLRVGGSRPEG